MSTNSDHPLTIKPQTSLGWRVLAIGVSTVLIVPLLGVLGSLLRLLLDPVSVNPDHPIQFAGGLGSVVISLALSILTLILGWRALKSGERSWAVWTGLILALLAGVLWVALIVMNIISGSPGY